MANYYQKEDKTEFFRTPGWMIEKCYEMIPNAKTILDPCAGDCGLEDFTRDVEYTLLDLKPRSNVIEQADFLKWTTEKHFDAAICNPPFGLKNEFLEHLFEFTDEVVYIITGKFMNDSYGLTESNAYPNDLTIQAIPLNIVENAAALVIARFEIGGRWFDDIVANNARREDEK